MSRYTASEVAELLFEEQLTESGDELDIEEDPAFPLPHEDDEEQAAERGDREGGLHEPLPPSSSNSVDGLEFELDPSSGGPTTSTLGGSLHLLHPTPLQPPAPLAPALPTTTPPFSIDGPPVSHLASPLPPPTHPAPPLLGTATANGTKGTPAWQRVESIDDRPQSQLPFQACDVGSTLQMPPESRPVDFFLHLIDDNICGVLVDETNRYANETIEALRASNQLRPHSIYQKWQPMTRCDLDGLLALILNMGLIDMPNLQDYWSTAWTTQVPFFSSIMTREKFQMMFWMLHVGHAESHPPSRIDKVKMFLEPLLRNFQCSYKPSRNISVDETMVGFRGRFGAKQYMPNKPTKYGIKAFTMADAAQGYMLNVLVYTGADTLGNAHPEYATLPQPARVVLQVIDPYLDKGHHVYTDRYYTSIPLARVLQERSTAFTGTSMRNRVGLPQIMRTKTKLADDEVVSFRDDRLMVLEWRAPKKKSSVILLSTQHSAQMTTVQLARNRGEAQKPAAIDHYNNSMNGVDRADQNSVYYSFIRKSRKWWRKLFFWLMEVAVVNSFILFQLHSQGKTSHLQYRRALIESLGTRYLQQVPPRPRPGRPRKRALSIDVGDPERLNGRPHFPGKSEDVQPQQCIVCSDRKTKRRRTLYHCSTCRSKPPLCPTPCFMKYHTRENYR